MGLVNPASGPIGPSPSLTWQGQEGKLCLVAGGRTYTVKPLHITERQLGKLRDDDWRKIAVRLTEILRKKHLLEGDELRPTKVRIEDTGVQIAPFEAAPLPHDEAESTRDAYEEIVRIISQAEQRPDAAPIQQPPQQQPGDQQQIQQPLQQQQGAQQNIFQPPPQQQQFQQQPAADQAFLNHLQNLNGRLDRLEQMIQQAPPNRGPGGQNNREMNALRQEMAELRDAIDNFEIPLQRSPQRQDSPPPSQGLQDVQQQLTQLQEQLEELGLNQPHGNEGDLKSLQDQISELKAMILQLQRQPPQQQQMPPSSGGNQELEEEIVLLQRQLEEQANQLHAESEVQLEELHEQNENLAAQITEKNQLLDKNAEQLSQIQQELARGTGTSEEQIARMRDLNAENVALQNVLRELQTEKGEAQTKLKTAQDNLQEKIAENDTQRAEYDAKLKDLEKTLKQSQANATRLSQEKADLEQRLEEIGQLEQRLRTQTSGQNALEGRLATAERENKNLQGNLQDSNIELNQQRAAHQRLQRESAELQRAKNEMEGQLGEVKTALATLQRKNEADRQIFEEQKQAITGQRGEMEAIKGQSQQAGTAGLELVQENEELRADNATLIEALDAAEEKQKQAEVTLTEAQTTQQILQEQVGQLHTLREQLKQVQKEKADLAVLSKRNTEESDAVHTQIDQQREDLQRQLNTTGEELESTKREHLTQMQELEIQIEQLKGKIADFERIQAELSRAQNELETQTARSKELETAYASLAVGTTATHLQEAQDQRRRAEQEAERLREHIQEMEQHLAPMAALEQQLQETQKSLGDATTQLQNQTQQLNTILSPQVKTPGTIHPAVEMLKKLQSQAQKILDRNPTDNSNLKLTLSNAQSFDWNSVPENMSDNPIGEGAVIGGIILPIINAIKEALITETDRLLSQTNASNYSTTELAFLLDIAKHPLAQNNIMLILGVNDALEQALDIYGTSL